jgi:hypothetical protein
MKKIQNNRFIYALYLLLLLVATGLQAQKDSVPAKELVRLKYFCQDNNVQYLLLENILKQGKKLTPLRNKSFSVYIDEISPDHLIAAVKTDSSGKAKSFIPPGLKTAWDATPQHKFLVVAGKEEDAASELDITKANIRIDTSTVEGTHSIIVTIRRGDGNGWKPAAGVEMKVGISRLGGILSAGSEETYTTDSTGVVAVALERKNLPGDEKGNITLAVKVEDNDELGNLIVEKSAGWGVPVAVDNKFFKQRTLWSTRFHTPFWLLFMAYSIVITVWSTIIYLVFQIVKIKKVGI